MLLAYCRRLSTTEPKREEEDEEDEEDEDEEGKTERTGEDKDCCSPPLSADTV